MNVHKLIAILFLISVAGCSSTSSNSDLVASPCTCDVRANTSEPAMAVAQTKYLSPSAGESLAPIQRASAANPSPTALRAASFFFVKMTVE